MESSQFGVMIPNMRLYKISQGLFSIEETVRNIEKLRFTHTQAYFWPIVATISDSREKCLKECFKNVKNNFH